MLGDDVDVRCRLVQDDDLALPKDRSTNADELPFTRREVGTALIKLELKSFVTFGKNVFELGSIKQVDDAFVRNLSLGVQVEAESASENSWVLWDYGDSRPKISEVSSPYVDAVDNNCAFKDLNDSTQRQADRAFTSACPAHYTNLLTGFRYERKAIENDFSGGSVAEAHVLEGDIASTWPVRVVLVDAVISLLRHCQHLETSFRAHHVLLHANEGLDGANH